MNHYYWKSAFFLFAVVQHSAVAFKIPGFSSSGVNSGSSINRTPPGGVRGPAPGAGGHRAPDSEYTGPVFIIRELDKDKGEYDAFVTTGGIQEVRPPPPMSDRSLPPLQHGNNNKPAPTAARDDEDSEHFGVLVTPETVRQLDLDEKLRTSSVNVTMAVLLSAASSRMPWLLVLHRKQYPHLFEYQQQQQQPQNQQQHQHQYRAHQPQQSYQPQQQQQYQPQQQQQYQPQQPSQPPQYMQADAVSQVQESIPGLQNPQIPQRRRYQTDRHRRGIFYGQPEDGRSPPMAFEHQLLSTMCYNFVRDYYSSSPAAHTSEQQMPRLPIALADDAAPAAASEYERESEPEHYGRYRQDVYLDANAYAAAATSSSGRVQKSPLPPPPPHQSPPQSSSTVLPEAEQSDGVVSMTIPKRVS